MIKCSKVGVDEEQYNPAPLTAEFFENVLLLIAGDESLQ